MQGSISTARFKLASGNGALFSRGIAVEQGGGLQQYGARDFRQYKQVDRLVLQRLKAANGLVELHPLGEIVNGNFQSSGHYTQQLGTGGNARFVQSPSQGLLGNSSAGDLLTSGNVVESQGGIKTTVDTLGVFYTQAAGVFFNHI